MQHSFMLPGDRIPFWREHFFLKVAREIYVPSGKISVLRSQGIKLKNYKTVFPTTNDASSADF